MLTKVVVSIKFSDCSHLHRNHWRFEGCKLKVWFIFHVLGVHEFKVEMVHYEGQGEDCHELSKGFAQADAFTAEEGTEGERVSHLAIWAQIHL